MESTQNFSRESRKFVPAAEVFAASAPGVSYSKALVINDKEA